MGDPVPNSVPALFVRGLHQSAGYNSAVEGAMTWAARVRVPASSTLYLVTAA